jgi:hypothetical protein
MRNRRQGERASLKEAPSTPGIRDFWFQDGNPEALRRYPDMPTTRRYGARITRWCAALGKSRPSDRGSITAECRAERLARKFWGPGDQIVHAFAQSVCSKEKPQPFMISQVSQIKVVATMVTSEMMIGIRHDDDLALRMTTAFVHRGNRSGCDNGRRCQRSRAYAPGDDLSEDHHQNRNGFPTG